MTAALQLLAMVTMFLVTFLIFQALGGRRETLLYSRADKEEWNRRIGTRLGSWFTLTSILGTLTSLATVYLFFIGNSRYFGAWILVCVAAIWGGAFVTNGFTRRICLAEHVRRILESNDQVGGVIASIFWRPTREGRATARIVKYLSLANILALIWLDFALFADISTSLLGLSSRVSPGLAGLGRPDLRMSMLLLICSAFAVIFFTLRYGLRGVIFADLFQSPMILLGTSVVFVGCIIALARHAGHDLTFSLLLPKASLFNGIVFALHVCCVNMALVLVTETHWLRLWIFRKREIEMQVRSIACTAGLWLLLIFIGFAAFPLSNGKVGEAAVQGLLQALAMLSPLLVVAFWIGGTAALFASADVQIYALLVVNEFDLKTGILRSKTMSTIRPFRDALVSSLLFGVAYYFVRLADIPFEKLVFLILPISLNLLPAFVRAARSLPQLPSLLLLSLGLYLFCLVVGLSQPRLEFGWTLMAAVMPCIVACIALIPMRRSPMEMVKTNDA